MVSGSEFDRGENPLSPEVRILSLCLAALATLSACGGVASAVGYVARQGVGAYLPVSLTVTAALLGIWAFVIFAQYWPALLFAGPLVALIVIRTLR